MPTSVTIPDSLHRSVYVEAAPSRVWDHVSRPGWWLEPQDDLGCRVEAAESAAPDFCAFTQQFNALPGAPNTRVEILIGESDGGEVRIRVSESGYGAWSDMEKAVLIHSQQTMLWETRLDELRRALS